LRATDAAGNDTVRKTILSLITENGAKLCNTSPFYMPCREYPVHSGDKKVIHSENPILYSLLPQFERQSTDSNHTFFSIQ